MSIAPCMPNTPNIAQYNIVCLQKNIKLQGKNLIGWLNCIMHEIYGKKVYTKKEK